MARSTAHRLLTTLVYRGFAEQTADRRDQASAVLRKPVATEPATRLRSVSAPHLRQLVDEVAQTANLMVSGPHARTGAVTRAVVRCPPSPEISVTSSAPSVR